MTDPTAIRPRRFRWLLRLVGLAALVVVAFLVMACSGIVQAASLQELTHADAIVIFGAAEYSGRPSPVLKARLDHGLDVFHHGVAPVVITTGGGGGDQSFTEGGVGRDYLMHHGIPERNLIAKTQGTDTSSSA